MTQPKATKGKRATTIDSVSKKFLRMAEVYKIFANDYKDWADFSDDMLIELYNQESYGGTISKNNGYGIGKKWLNVTVKMWKEDMTPRVSHGVQMSTLFKKELYEDPKFPHWWLDSIFNKE